MEPASPAEPDRGLDSPADLRLLERLLFFGLAAAIIVGVVALLVTGEWSVLLVVVVAYAVIAGIQWVAVHRRMRGNRDPR
jgi:membrane protein implicated in regulation of membrane protease activity